MVWRVLLVDDETLARARLRALLDELRPAEVSAAMGGAAALAPTWQIGEAANAVQALSLIHI